MNATLLPEINLNRCTGCGDCAQGCPHHALVMQTGQPIFARPQACTFCASCEELCASRAIRCAFEITWDGPIDQEVHKNR